MTKKSTFELEFSVTATIEIDDSVFDAVDDDWKKTFYNLETKEDIAEMIARCMTMYHYKLSELDGWADMPDENAKLGEVMWETISIKESE